MRGRRAAATLSVAALAIAGAGCGGDDSDEATPTPEISVPAGASQTVPEGKTTPEPGVTPTGSGGTTYDPNKPDSPTNDIPPEPGSPQAEFERQCAENPAACG